MFCCWFIPLCCWFICPIWFMPLVMPACPIMPCCICRPCSAVGSSPSAAGSSAPFGSCHWSCRPVPSCPAASAAHVLLLVHPPLLLVHLPHLVHAIGHAGLSHHALLHLPPMFCCWFIPLCCWFICPIWFMP